MTEGLALDLMLELERAGGALWLEEGGLRYRAPTGAMSPERLERLRSVKSHLIALLEAQAAAPPRPPSIAPTPLQDHYPLSYQQETLFSGRSEADRPEPLSIGLRVFGPVTPELLSRTLAHVVRQIDILRARIERVDGELRQTPEAAGPPGLELADAQAPPGTDLEEHARNLFAAYRREIDAGGMRPGLRSRLFRMTEEDHLLVLSVERVVADEFSMFILARKVIWTHHALLNDIPAPVMLSGLQYRDYAVWEKTCFDPAAREPYFTFRRARASGMRLPLKAGADRSIAWRAGRRLPIDIGGFDMPQMRDLANSERVTVTDVVTTSVLAAIHRWAQADQPQIDFLRAIRGTRETMMLVGNLARNLGIEATIEHDLTLRGLLRRVCWVRQLSEKHLAFEGPGVPRKASCDRIVMSFRSPPQDWGPSETLAEHVHRTRGSESWRAPPQVSFKPLAALVEGFRIDYTAGVHFVQQNDCLQASCVYAEDLLERREADRFVAAFEAALADLNADPDRCVRLDSVAERHGQVELAAADA